MPDYRLKKYPSRLKATINRLEQMKENIGLTEKAIDSLHTAILALQNAMDEVDVILKERKEKQG